jgi:hypothetical protein
VGHEHGLAFVRGKKELLGIEQARVRFRGSDSRELRLAGGAHYGCLF